MKNYDDLALIVKKIVYEDGSVELIPLEVLEGVYNDNNKVFIDLDGTPYHHIITNPDSIGFMYRDNIVKYKKNYPYLSVHLIKKLILHTSKKYLYMYCIARKENDSVPVILHDNKKLTNGLKLLLDGDILEFYMEEFPEFIESILNNKSNEESNLNIGSDKPKQIDNAIDISKMYTEITSNVIDQDEPIKKILTAIWKQYNNFSESKSRNILINGSTGVGKTETFRCLTKMLTVPYFETSATEYTAEGYIGKSVSDMLIGLLRNANYDLEKAERGILIIDEIDKLSQANKNNSQINQRDVQEALLKILEDGVFALNVNNKEYMFDTSKLMVIGMGSWSRIELREERPVGFDSKYISKTYKDITREDIVAEGMIPELIGRFPIIVQMNELNYESFIKILNSKNSALNMNKKFLSSKGIILSTIDGTLNEIAKQAVKGKYGARSLDEIIEKALSEASFEIAINPDVYSELIISPDTIKDNKKYTLIKKKEDV